MNNRFCRTVGLILFVAMLSVSTATTFAQSGGNTITQSVIVSGGNTSENANGTLSLTGTIGQSTAGARSFNNPFVVTGGFWNSEQFSPTAAMVLIEGRILTADGRGIKNVRVTLMEANGNVKTALSGAFGYYSFSDIEVGQLVVVSITAKNYTFNEPVRMLTVTENINDFDFTGLSN